MTSSIDRGVAIVTGGSRGIGAATSIRLADAGYTVVVNYATDAEAAARMVGRIVQAGGRASAVQADLGTPAEIEALFAAADKLGQLTALVNNAGIIGGRMGTIETFAPDAMRRLLDINVLGCLVAGQLAVARMSTARGGKGGGIVNLSSVAAKLGGANAWVPYAATKGAIDSFTVGLAREVAAQGIRVNAVAPGLIDTTIHAQAGAADRLRTGATQVPMQRAGTADEVAAAIAWLLSDEAAYITGAVLDVGGGR
jgi:NAD(P)-dependent dehydrogenase (short-subunit alcohol dehydrogenase family)